MDASVVSAALFDSRGTFLALNRAMARSIGLPLSKILGALFPLSSRRP